MSFFAGEVHFLQVILILLILEDSRGISTGYLILQAGHGGDKGVRRGRPRASVSPQTERKFGPGMGRKRWNLDICPFEAARWVALFVHFTPNGRARTGWGRAVELALGHF